MTHSMLLGNVLERGMQVQAFLMNVFLGEICRLTSPHRTWASGMSPFLLSGILMGQLG